MKKHELLKYAYDNYPKGTKFKNLANGEECISSGVFEISDYGILNSLGVKNYIFGRKEKVSWGDKWAEIIKLKIAVKVENEKEFKALMKYYKSICISLGTNKGCNWSSWSGKPLCIQFHDNAVTMYEEFAIGDIEFKDYQIITFSEFSKQKGIKLPLLTSEDGVDLYDDSDIHIVWKDGAGWEYDNHHIGFKSIDGSWYVNPEIIEPQRKLFSTKQAALDWIDAQKPKETVLEFGAYKFTIKHDSVNVSHGDIDTFIDIKSINEAMFSLQL